MAATFAVPASPAEPGALLFFFSGAQFSNGNLIAQPVLQYGCNQSFGGNYWTIASWLFNCNGWSFYSEPKRVNPNDTIVGSMEKTCEGKVCNWRITTTDSTINETTSLVVDNLNFQPGNFYGGAFEAYNVTSCLNQYPASRSLTFQNITIKGPDGRVFNPVWSHTVLGTCGGLNVSTDATTTTLKY